MSAVYVVCEHSGSYSDYSITVLNGYKLKERAEEEMKRLEAYQEKIRAAAEENRPMWVRIYSETDETKYNRPLWDGAKDGAWAKWKKEVGDPLQEKRETLCRAAAQEVARKFGLEIPADTTRIWDDYIRYTIEEIECEES